MLTRRRTEGITMSVPSLAVLMSLTACLGTGPEGGGTDLLIVNARLFDATGAPPRGSTAILIRDGRIAAIGPEVDAPNARRLDAEGGTVLPGLIDCHVHLASSPGAPQRGD